MKKLLIIVSSQKPVPAVKNGAIQVRVENVIKYNETHPMYDITVISIYDAEAVPESKKYGNTQFWFVKTSDWEKKIYFYCKAIINRLPVKVAPPKELYHVKCFNKLRRHKNRFDKILIENVVPLVEKTKKISHASVYLHLGSDGLNKETPGGREIAGNLDKIFVVSDYIGALVKGIPGIDPEKVIKINQGIERSLFTEKPVRDRDELRRSLGIDTEDVVYEFHGRLTADKGVKELILAFSALKYDHAKLMILGSKSSWTVSDAYIDEIRTLAEKLQEKVIVTGEIPHDQIGGLSESGGCGGIAAIMGRTRQQRYSGVYDGRIALDHDGFRGICRVLRYECVNCPFPRYRSDSEYGCRDGRPVSASGKESRDGENSRRIRDEVYGGKSCQRGFRRIGRLRKISYRYSSLRSAVKNGPLYSNHRPGAAIDRYSPALVLSVTTRC